MRRERATEDAGDQEIDAGLTPEEATARREAHDTLETILDTMGLERRAVFVMFDVEEMSCEEIAAMLGIPVGTV